MLIGSYQHTVDEKGRIFIPSKLKSELGDGFVLVRGFRKNIIVYPKKQFEAFAAKYMEQPLSDLAAQDFFRMFFASARECDTDKQGRVLLPAELREYAGIGVNVTLIGMMNRLEIWDPDALSASSNISEEKYLATLSEMAQRGV